MTTNSKDILVLGATGKTGRRLVPRLRAAGATVRAASRTGEVRFDWSEPATWPDALAGAGALYLIAPDDPAPVPAFVQQATDAGVRRVVVLSGRGLDRVDDFGHGMAAAERAVRDAGLQWTIIRANNFHQNFDEDLWRAPVMAGRLALPIGDVPEPFVDAGLQWTIIRANNFHQNFDEDLWRAPVMAGRLALPIGDVPEPFVDAEDIADVAAALLTRDGHAGQIYDLSGPRDLTFAEAAAAVAEAAGRPVRYVELTPAEYRDELKAEGYPPAAIDALDALFAAHRAGILAGPADGVQRVLGRDPVDFTVYAARAARAGAWA